MDDPADVKLAGLSRFVFSAPSWRRSLLIAVVLGLAVDLGLWLYPVGGPGRFFGTLAFTVPTLAGFLLTRPLVEALDRPLTWNRSALLAAASMIFMVLITMPAALLARELLPLVYACAIGFALGLRLLVLVAVSDYRVLYMLGPAATQPAVAVAVGAWFFGTSFLPLAVLLAGVFLLGFALLIWLIERPLHRAFGIRGLSFLNAFIAHLTDGSRAMEEFFRSIGESVTVPQTSFFFRREGRPDLVLTVPNVHPGPMGEIGGGNIPVRFAAEFEEAVMVPHGCATHDFNLVSEDEIAKLVAGVQATKPDLAFGPGASGAVRRASGTVSLLCQRLGDGLLVVATRAPLTTEDLDFSFAPTFEAEGRRRFANLAFVDAHNCMGEDWAPVLPGTPLGSEYLRGVREAVDSMAGADLGPFAVGYDRKPVPFSREQGFGDLGVQVLVVEAGGRRTAYVLVDGNNMVEGGRETLVDRCLELVDEAEVMTTDSHVVNTVTGKNPVGMRVPVSELAPVLERALRAALADLGPATVASSTAWCDNVVVFGSTRIVQLASTVNAMLVFVAPLSLAILLLAFVLSVVTYLVLL
jgi:putative membrane protein